MATKTAADRLAALEAKRAQLSARIDQVKAAEAKRERTLDTRRKVLIGAVMQLAVQNGQVAQDQLTKLLDRFLSKPKDRALFGL